MLNIIDFITIEMHKFASYNLICHKFCDFYSVSLNDNILHRIQILFDMRTLSSQMIIMKLSFIRNAFI